MNKTRRIKNNTLLLHITGCILFMCIPIFSYRGSPGDPDGPGTLFYYNMLFEYALTIVFFYLNYLYLIPRFYFKRQYALFIFAALMGFVVVDALPELLSYLFCGHGPMRHIPIGPPPGMRHFRHHHAGGNIPFTHLPWRVLGPFDQNFLKCVAVLVLAISLKVTEQLKKIEKEKAESEVMFLKAQINPHFLFNTLNSIYTLAIEAGAGSTAKAIAQLSGMMRYATSEASAEMVALLRELSYIDNYVTLQRLRINENVQLFYMVEGHAGNARIAPFLLIPFIENAFKYGVSTEQPSDIRVQIMLRDGTLYLHVVNTKVYVSPGIDHGTSIGIDNTRKRLELLYPGRHELKIEDAEDKFDVQLNVTL